MQQAYIGDVIETGYISPSLLWHSPTVLRCGSQQRLGKKPVVLGSRLGALPTSASSTDHVSPGREPAVPARAVSCCLQTEWTRGLQEPPSPGKQSQKNGGWLDRLASFGPGRKNGGAAAGTSGLREDQGPTTGLGAPSICSPLVTAAKQDKERTKKRQQTEGR